MSLGWLCLATPRHRPRWPTPRHRALHAPFGACSARIRPSKDQNLHPHQDDPDPADEKAGHERPIIILKEDSKMPVSAGHAKTVRMSVQATGETRLARQVMR